MKQTKFYHLLAIILIAVLFACGSKTSKTPDSSQGEEVKSESVLKIGKGKYAIKSGIVEYKTKVMGFDATQITYFDDRGGKEANETVMEIMGMKNHSMSVTKDGWIYNYDVDKRTGTKMPISGKTGNIDFENLTEQIQEEMKIKKVGEETYFNKPCTKYSIDNEALQMKGFFWVWKGIALKTEVDMSTMKMLLEVVRLDENANVPAEKFEIPSDIVFQ